MELILFDVDGTLIKGSRVHYESFLFAMNKVFGINDDKLGTPPGSTDKFDILEIGKRNGVEKSEIENNLKKIYNFMIKYFEENVNSDEKLMLNLGVKELLEKLNKEKNYIVGLLTGNIEQIAWLKMKKLGIYHYFKLGAFGGVTHIRSELVPIAIRKAKEKFKTKIRKEDVFIVGDTPNDIKCGKDNGVRTTAVCTGQYTREELEKYQPDYIFDDLTNTDEFLETINQ